MENRRSPGGHPTDQARADGAGAAAAGPIEQRNWCSTGNLAPHGAKAPATDLLAVGSPDEGTGDCEGV